MEEEKEKIGQMNAKIIALVLKHTKIAILITTLTTIIYFRLGFHFCFSFTLCLLPYLSVGILLFGKYIEEKKLAFSYASALFFHIQTNKRNERKNVTLPTDICISMTIIYIVLKRKIALTLIIPTI